MLAAWKTKTSLELRCAEDQNKRRRKKCKLRQNKRIKERRKTSKQKRQKDRKATKEGLSNKRMLTKPALEDFVFSSPELQPFQL
jgi:hypothetical protein